MKSLRLTEEQLRTLEARKKQWQAEGRVKTHRITLPGETVATDKNKNGGKRGKYGNIKAEAEGIKFHSRREANRWMALRLMEKAGEIKDLQRQVAYPIEVNGIKICDYIADFVYEKGEIVVEDAKGYRTEIFNLKAKLMKAVHGVEILLT